MVNDKDEKFEDNVVRQAIPAIQAREDPTIPAPWGRADHGDSSPSSRSDVDNAVYGVATWETWDATAVRFRIYARGLSDGYKEIPSPSGGKAFGKAQDPQDRFHPRARDSTRGTAA